MADDGREEQSKGCATPASGRGSEGAASGRGRDGHARHDRHGERRLSPAHLHLLSSRAIDRQPDRPHAEGGRGVLDRGDRASVRLLGGHGVAADLAREADDRGQEPRIRDAGARRISRSAWGRRWPSSTRCSTRATPGGAARSCGSTSRRRRCVSRGCSATSCRASPRRSARWRSWRLALRARTHASTTRGCRFCSPRRIARGGIGSSSAKGLMALRRARSLGGRGPYVLQAEIAAAHVMAPKWESTDWATIVAAYDELAEVSPSPVVALNRAVAVSMLAGPSAGLAALAALERPLADYHLFYAARADMLERTGGDPRPDLEKAICARDERGREAPARATARAPLGYVARVKTGVAARAPLRAELRGRPFAGAPSPRARAGGGSPLRSPDRTSARGPARRPGPCPASRA